jgi:predicted outer membrane repeat protein
VVVQTSSYQDSSSVFTNNIASSGGAILGGDMPSSIVLSGSTFTNNKADEGISCRLCAFFSFSFSFSFSFLFFSFIY